jgi:glycosyltransferase involved in cell wall biosynthesis
MQKQSDSLLSSPRRLRHQFFLSVILPRLTRLVYQPLTHSERRALIGSLRCLIRPAQGAPHAPPIYVVGFLASLTGAGEGARLTIRALQRLGCRVHEIDVGEHFALQDFSTTGGAPYMEHGPGTIIFHFNPEALALSIYGAGRAALRGKRRVGYWAWETTQIPKNWMEIQPYLDEIWVPSEFVAQAVRAATKLPVFVVPHPVAVKPAGHRIRKRFDLREDTFIVLTMGSFQSGLDRKNLIGAIDAFRAAFGNDERAQLLVKVSHRFSETLDQQSLLMNHIGDAKNIRIYDEMLSDASVRNLVASVDVLLSLHRSEGFGLVLAEAMQSGTPVVATDWSGNTDFMDKDTAAMIPATLVPAIDSSGFFSDPRAQWAEPSILEAADRLKQLANDPAFRDKIGQRARQRVERQLGLDAFRQAIIAALGYDPTGKAAANR